MKFKDIFKIACLRLNNKNSKRTIIAMSISMIMIIPIIWLCFAFYFDFRTQIDAIAVNNVFLYESNLADSIQNQSKDGQEYLKAYGGVQLQEQQFKTLENETAISWTEFVINRENEIDSNLIEMQINDKKANLNNSPISIKFIKNGEVKTHPESIENYIAEKFQHELIYGKGFSKNKAELYVSENFVNSIGLSKDEIIGKTISLSINYQNYPTESSLQIFDNDNNSTNKHIRATDSSYQSPIISGDISFFSKYTVVGVICKEYYEINNLTATDSIFWMKDSSLVMQNGESIMPTMSIQKINSDFTNKNMLIITYKNNDFYNFSKQVTQEGIFFPLFLGNYYLNNINNSNNMIYPIQKSFVQYSNFNDAKNKLSLFNNFMDMNGKSNLFYAPYSIEFGELLSTSEIIDIICVVLALIGGITIITISVNFINTINFNARKRKDYLVMMKKMGITEKEKNYLVLMEVCGIFVIASLIALIFSLMIVFMLKIIIEKFLLDYLIFSNFTLKLIYFVPTFALIFLFFSLLFISVALTANNKKANKITGD